MLNGDLSDCTCGNADIRIRGQYMIGWVIWCPVCHKSVDRMDCPVSRAEAVETWNEEVEAKVEEQ